MEQTKKQSVFSVLSSIDVSEHVETKKAGGVELSYLSWAWAWHICKEHYPDAFYTIYENEAGRPYFDDGRTCWVKTGVTIAGQEHIEYLPVMDYRNLSIPVDRVTSMDMNKSIQRSLTKALARHGLGLYIYAGEDLPWTEEQAKEREAAEAEATKKTRATRKVTTAPAAQPEPQPQPAAQPKKADDPAVIRAKWVRCIAEGIKTRSGKDPREAYIAAYRPDEDALAALDDEVFNYRMDHGIKAQPVNA